MGVIKVMYSPADPNGMVRIPVTVGFDHKSIVGFLEVLETSLPPTENFHYAIGGYRNPNGSITITEVSLVANPCSLEIQHEFKPNANPGT